MGVEPTTATLARWAEYLQLLMFWIPIDIF